MYNQSSLDSVAGALAYAMGIEAPHAAAPANGDLCAYVDKVLGSTRADRVFMYNPDAIAQWVYEKYPQLCTEGKRYAEIELPLLSVMPSVTPVCFATMYSGAQPEVHGIRKYERPVLTVDTLFDAMLRAGKRVAIIGDTHCSMGMIFRERNMDYFVYDTIEEINAKAVELIVSDEYDFIACYNGNYDTIMHKYGTESVEAMSELRANYEVFGLFSKLIEAYWGSHNTLVGFAMDHGCHDMDHHIGAHGLDMEEDLNIVHLYRVYPAK